MPAEPSFWRSVLSGRRARPAGGGPIGAALRLVQAETGTLLSSFLSDGQADKPVPFSSSCPPFRQFLYAPFQRFGARRGAPARRLQKALLAFRKSTTWNFYTSKCFSTHQVMLFAVAYGPQKTGVSAEKFAALSRILPKMRRMFHFCVVSTALLSA